MPLPFKNTISTSFTIDLSTIDKKMDKIVKYFQNSEIDVKDDGLRFVNYEVDYKSLEQSLRNKKYKQSLSTIVSKIYSERFVNTRAALAERGLVGESDFLSVQPLDDFGSKFDAFAATNTDPDNTILQVLGVNPYKYLKVDIFTEQDLKTYNDNISAYYDVEKLTYILQKLENITSTYVAILSFDNAKSYIDRLNAEILLPQYQLDQLVPGVQSAVNLFDAFSAISFDIKTNNFAFDTLAVVDPEIYAGLNKEVPQKYDYTVIEKAKIKILDFIIRNAISETLENKIAVTTNLDNFNSQYSGYNFFEQKFKSSAGTDLSVRKENIYFKLTFYRQSPQLLIQETENRISDTKIEFNLISNLKIQSPFGDPSIKNNKFVAILSGQDLSVGTPIEFFEPTILAILSDINYISNNILEIDPFYCPTPESLEPTNRVNTEQYLKNEVVIENVTKSKHFIDSNPFAFNYKTFPDLYFIPNLLMGPDAFFEAIEQPSLSRDKSLDIIKKYSKYYYSSESETPAAAISRDQNMKKLFENAAMRNGFYGLYEARKDSFADPALVEQIISKIDGLAGNAVNEIQDIIFARTNIACLLKEFQTCFLPKVGNCRDVLRGFRFSELEDIVKKTFPESAYPTLFESIKIFKSNSIKDQREKQLLLEIENLEKQLENNDRKKIVFQLLDRKIEPATALNRADDIQGIGGDNTTLKERYEQKLLEYRQFKEDQTIVETQPIGTEPVFQQVDQFLDLLEENGIDIEVLCDLAKLITDLSQISFTFGTISLPELPTIDIFQETKIAIDLAIVEIIFQTVVAFIRNILQELLTCNGIKDLIKAGLTGEAEGLGLAATTAAALNQVARGQFDLNEFVDNNPQIDPKQFKKGIDNLAISLANSVAVTDTTAIGVNAEIGLLGQVSAGAVSSTTMILANPNAGSVTEQEIVIALGGLISQLSNVLTPLQFINLIGGKASSADIVQVTSYIQQNNPQLSYLANTNVIKNIFRYISDISGLGQVRGDLINVAATYSNLLSQTRNNKFCFDIATEPELDNINNISQEELQKQKDQVSEVETNRSKYRGLIRDLLKASPEQLKTIVDESVFKPILSGMLPNGKPNPAVDVGNRKRIKNTLKPIANKFKSNSNSFYSKLTLKKTVEREIEKFIQDENGRDTEQENPEYKNQINLGGYSDGYSLPIVVKEEKYIYGGVFSENFPQAAETFDVDLSNQQVKFSVRGKKAQTSRAIQELYNSISNGATENGIINSENEWKIENIQNQSENIIKVFEGQNEKFSYHLKFDSSSNAQEVKSSKEAYDQVLKDEIYSSLINIPNTFNEDFAAYTRNSYDNFLSSIYKKISETISQDGLLKPIENVPLDGQYDNILSALSSSLNINLNIGTSPVGVANPNIDTPLKYVNFCPKPTKQQKINNKDPGLYGLLEIQNLTAEILNKRNQETSNLKDLQQMLKDGDYNLDLALIDSLIISLIKTMSADFVLRSLFILRTFKFEKDIIKDLLLASYIAESVFNEIRYFANKFKKNSFLSLTQEHIDYLHMHIFDQQIKQNTQDPMFVDINKIKNKITSLTEDRRILLLYKNRIRSFEAGTQSDPFIQKVDDYIRCLKDEIKHNKQVLIKLQIRNIAYSELLVMFDKLTYLTSTNEKVTSELEPECKKDLDYDSDNFLKNLVPQILLKTTPEEVFPSEGVDEYLQNQERKMKSGVFAEHYVLVPLIKTQYSRLRAIQLEKKTYGVQSLSDFLNLTNKIESESSTTNEVKRNFTSIFEKDLKYGIRIIHIQQDEPYASSFIDYEDEIDANQSMADRLKQFRAQLSKNIDSLKTKNKNKFYLSEEKYINFKNTNIESTGVIESYNIYYKAYSVPFIKKISSNLQIGMINYIPIVDKSTSLGSNISSIVQIKALFNNLKSGVIEAVTEFTEGLGEVQILGLEEQNRLRGLIKQVVCDDKFTSFYELLTNKNLLSNFMILSSINILNSKEIQSSFGSVRYQIMSDILAKTQSIYNKNNNEAYEEMMEWMSSPDFFKIFNAEAIIKTLIRAAIYVLQYYCQMTDPNISLALLIRNAVKLALGASSQVASSLGNDSIPPELPLPLSLLAPYSLGQLPITVFGVPPVGIGIGPPLTPPGMVLLGAELLLLNLEFSENMDKNTEDQKIKDLMKKYCFNLEGYKKYGV